MNSSKPLALFPVADANNTVKIDYYNIQKAAMVLRALNHKLRQQIIKTINENESLTVTDLYVKMRMEQSVTSQHLAILRRAGIVSTHREGKCIHYSINEQRIDEIAKFAEDITGRSEL